MGHRGRKTNRTRSWRRASLCAWDPSCISAGRAAAVREERRKGRERLSRVASACCPARPSRESAASFESEFGLRITAEARDEKDARQHVGEKKKTQKQREKKKPTTGRRENKRTKRDGGEARIVGLCLPFVCRSTMVIACDLSKARSYWCGEFRSIVAITLLAARFAACSSSAASSASSCARITAACWSCSTSSSCAASDALYDSNCAAA